MGNLEQMAKSKKTIDSKSASYFDKVEALTELFFLSQGDPVTQAKYVRHIQMLTYVEQVKTQQLEV